MAANFDGHKLVSSPVENFVALGLMVGKVVELAYRYTVDFDPTTKGRRKDMDEGTQVSIKGYADDKVVVEFSATFNKKAMKVDVALKPQNLRQISSVVDPTVTLAQTKVMSLKELIWGFSP